MDKHRKHAKLKLRDNDNFAPNEIAILGTKCSIISDLVHHISKNISKYKLAYFDASHSKEINSNFVDTYTFQYKGVLESSVQSEVNKYNQRNLNLFL